MKKMNIDLSSFESEMKLKSISQDAKAHESFFDGIVDTQSVVEYLSAIAYTIKTSDNEEEKMDIIKVALEKIKSLKITTMELNEGKRLWIQLPVVLVESKYEIPLSSRVKNLFKRKTFIGKIAYARNVQVISNTCVPLQMRVDKEETKISENDFVNDFFVSVSYLAYKITAMCEQLQINNISIFQNEDAIRAGNNLRGWMEDQSKEKDFGFSDVNLSDAISTISISDLLLNSEVFNHSEREDLELIEIGLDDEDFEEQNENEGEN